MAKQGAGIISSLVTWIVGLGLAVAEFLVRGIFGAFMEALRRSVRPEAPPKKDSEIQALTDSRHGASEAPLPEDRADP